MGPNDIRSLIERDPFQPFRIHLSDGSKIDVADPVFITLTRTDILVGDPYDEEGWPTVGRYINMRQIMQIETLPTAS